MSLNKVLGAVAALLALFVFPTVAMAQPAAGCFETDECLEQCEDPTDADCVNACLEQTEPELRGIYQAVFTCFTESGCDLEDDECIFEACEDQLVALFDACGDEDPCETNPGEDCCIFANDDECDEPDLCAEGTDTTDCTNFPPEPGCDEEPGPDCCEFANDGECDEPDFCDEGTDTTDCGGNPVPEPDPTPEPEADPQPDPQPDGNPDAFNNDNNNPGDDPEPEGGGSGGSTDSCATVPGQTNTAALLLLLGLVFFLRRRL